MIIGSRGQLGTALTSLFEKRNVFFYGVDMPEFDITDTEITTGKINELNPDIIINASGYTNVKKAELEMIKALQINSVCLKSLSEICNKKGIHLCHISTDYVFDGRNKDPYIENDKTKPINFYGLTKELGEKIIQNYCDDYVIIRTAALYGKSKIKSENVVDKIIHFAANNHKISSVIDEYTSPTFSNDLARQILLILQSKVRGIVHATSEGYCNWYEFANCVFDIMKMRVDIRKVTSADFSQDLKKPLFSVLENSRLNSLNINIMPHWKDALQTYLENN